MLGRTTGAALTGVDARLVDIEVHLGGGLPTFSAVGLPGAAVREGLDRIRVALKQSGFDLPRQKVVINLAPAELRKQGAALDLPIATALLAADGRLGPPGPAGTVVCGELALDGAVRPVRGAIAIAAAARDDGRRRVVVPAGNAQEAGVVRGIEVVAVRSLLELAAVCRGEPPETIRVDVEAALRDGAVAPGVPDLAEVTGQALARRGLEVAAAGGHHLLLVGPPGSGKTMLARRMPGILPPLTVEDSLEITRVWSAAGMTDGLVTRRPFRAPHHGVSAAGLVGGGAVPRPGEVSLATRGVLFLDELPEFRRDALEALRQPLEEGGVTIRRVHGATRFPARFALVAAMNPCPCGHHGAPDGRCVCGPHEIRAYRGKLSGPLLDRFDVVVEVPAVDLGSLASRERGEASVAVRARAAEARERQGGRGAGINARLDGPALDRWAELDPTPRRVLLHAADRLGLSARGFERVRRVARTLADLGGAERIGTEHVAEAVQLRRAGEVGT